MIGSGTSSHCYLELAGIKRLEDIFRLGKQFKIAYLRVRRKVMDYLDL